MILEIKNIEKSYGSQRVLCGIDYNFQTSGVVGLIGPNGAGKSTLMKIVTGYISPDNGEVMVLGDRVEVDSVVTKKYVGYLPEHNPLYLEMYVREYLEYVAAAYGIKAAAQREAVERVIQETGLAKEQTKRLGQLSKGYRQRVGIAAAIIHRPKILILDEPTTGLDPNQLIEIRELIAKLGTEHLVIFSTHIMQEVDLLCDDIIILSKGSIVFSGSKVELKEQHGSVEQLFYKVTN